MLNLNVSKHCSRMRRNLMTRRQPAMRPSAAQLLQHERIDLAFKVAETQKMYVHKTRVDNSPARMY